MLKMKKHCERCEAATLPDSLAYICSFECTFCETCATDMHGVCPNCAGELLRRPTRVKKPIEVAASQIKNKLFGKK